MKRKSKTMSKSMATETKKSKPLDDDSANRKTITKSSSINVVRVRITDVSIPDGCRSINEKAVNRLADSMSAIGLKTPITVRINSTGTWLVAGRHRFEAAKKLGWNYIEAIVTRDDKLDRQLWQAAENIHRTDLTALQDAEAVTRWAKLVVKKAAQHAHPGGRQPHDKGVSKAAKAIGVTRDNVRRSNMIADISSAAKAAIIDAGLADKQSALLKIANERTPRAQLHKVRELAKPKRAAKSGLSGKARKQFKRLKRRFADAVELHQAWIEADKIARDHFIAHIRKLAPTG